MCYCSWWRDLEPNLHLGELIPVKGETLPTHLNLITYHKTWQDILYIIIY